MKIKYKDSERYKNILVIVTGLLLISLLFQVHWPSIAAVVIGTVSLVIPPAGKLIVAGWLKLAEVLGFINSRILLTLIYGIYLIPWSIVYKLTNKEVLDIRKNNKSSLFHKRDHTYTKKDLEKTW